MSEHGPEWLSEDEQATWRAYLAATRRFMDALDHQLQHDVGMPLTYYEILVHLSEAPGRRLRMGHLAAACHASRSRLSHAVARLEEAGWVQRETTPDDGRGAVAVLTAEGFATLQTAAPGHVRAVRDHLFTPLRPDEQDALHHICQAILATMPEPGDPA